MKESHDTIIVGAGIAGLACAHTLHRDGRSFKIISEDIGGRIRTSKDGQVNYGAALVSADYDHVFPHIELVERIKMSDLYFHGSGRSYPMFSPRIIQYGLQPLRLLRELKKFRKAYAKFRKDTETMSQKEVIESDPYLKKLFFQKADEFAKEKNISGFCHAYLCQGLYPLAFTSSAAYNAFLYLHFLQPLIMPMHTFRFKKDEMIQPFKEHITIDSVVAVEKIDNGYLVKTKKNAFQAKNVVVATPLNTSRKLLGISGGKLGVNSYVIHVDGALKDEYKSGKARLFHPPEVVSSIFTQRDGSHLVYSSDDKIDLEKFFDSFKIIDQVFWEPAEFMLGAELLDSNQGKNLYMIGDYNVGGLEASFITGVYAANQIVSSAK